MGSFTRRAQHQHWTGRKIGELEGKSSEIKVRRAIRMKKNEQNLRNLWQGNYQADQALYYGNVTDRREKKGTESLFEEKVTDNFLNLKKEIDFHIKVAQKAPTRITPKKTTLTHFNQIF